MIAKVKGGDLIIGVMSPYPKILLSKESKPLEIGISTMVKTMIYSTYEIVQYT